MQLFARLGTKPSLETLDTHLFPKPHHFPKPGDVIELYGTTCCAKTEVLYHLLAQCILPPSWNGIEFGSLGVGAVFVDTEYQFSMLRLFAILEKRVTEKLDEIKKEEEEVSKETPSSENIESFIRTSLSKLHLVRCSSSEQLIISLHSLESLFANHPEISVLMLDSVSAFYWIDKTNAGDNSTNQESMQRKMVDILTRLVKEYHLVLFATKPAIVQKRHRVQKDQQGTFEEASPLNTSISEAHSGTERIEHHEYLCSAWHKLVSYRYIIRRHDEGFEQGSAGEKLKRSVFKATLIHPSSVMHHCVFCITDGGVSYM